MKHCFCSDVSAADPGPRTRPVAVSVQTQLSGRAPRAGHAPSRAHRNQTTKDVTNLSWRVVLGRNAPPTLQAPGHARIASPAEPDHVISSVWEPSASLHRPRCHEDSLAHFPAECPREVATVVLLSRASVQEHRFAQDMPYLRPVRLGVVQLANVDSFDPFSRNGDRDVRVRPAA